jgi:hypothetical protein
MATFGQLRTRIKQKIAQDYLNEDTSEAPVSRIGQAINDAIEYYQRYQFWFNTDYDVSGVMTVNDALLTMPSNYLYAIEISLTYGNITYILGKVSNEVYDYQNAQATGRPEIYTQRGTSTYVYFIPDMAYPYQVTYVKGYAALVDDADFNDFTVEAAALIEAHALAELYLDARHSQGPDSLHEAYNRKEQQELRNLQIQNNMRSATGQLMTSSLLMNNYNEQNLNWNN